MAVVGIPFFVPAPAAALVLVLVKVFAAVFARWHFD